MSRSSSPDVWTRQRRRVDPRPEPVCGRGLRTSSTRAPPRVFLRTARGAPPVISCESRLGGRFSWASLLRVKKDGGVNCGRNYPELTPGWRSAPWQITVLEYAHACGADHGRGRRGIRQDHPMRRLAAARRARARGRARPASPTARRSALRGARALRGRGPAAHAAHPGLPLHGRAPAARGPGDRRPRSRAGAWCSPIATPTRRSPTRATARAWIVQTIRELNVLATGGVLARSHACCSTSIPSRACGASRGRRARHLRAHGPRLPPPRARGLSRDRPRRQASACSCFDADREPDALHAESRARWTRRSAGGSRGMAPAVGRFAERDPSRAQPSPQAVEHAPPRARQRAASRTPTPSSGPHGSGRKATALAFATAPRARRRCGRRRRPDRWRGACTPTCTCSSPRRPSPIPRARWPIRVDGVRELERQAALRPAEAPVKVFIVDEAEKMTPRHAAGLPQDAGGAARPDGDHPHPGRRPGALPATVLSRCQIVRFLPAPAEGTLALLPDGRGEARARALRAARQGDDGRRRRGARRRRSAGPRPRGGGDRRRDLLALVPRSPRGAGASRAAAGLRRARGGGARPRRRRSRWTTIVRGLAACREARLAIAGNVSPRLSVEMLLSRLATAA